MMNDRCGMAQPSVGGVSPGQGVLDGIRKQVGQVMENKPVSNIAPWPLLQFLLPGSSLDCSQSWTESSKMK